MAAGIEIRHARTCTAPREKRCPCGPSYRAVVYDRRSGRKATKTLGTLTGAKQWRQDALVALRQGTLSEAQPRVTLAEAFDRWEADARAGVVTTRSGDPYKPSAIRGYAQSLRLRVMPDLGDARFHAVRRVDLQDLIDRLVAAGHAPATVMGAITPLRALYGRAVNRGELDVNPTTGLKLPAVRTRRERFASPEEAARLVAAVPEGDRIVWACALYTGLRRGELMGLRWEDCDLKAATLQVARGWDVEHGAQETKNRQRRRVPIPAGLLEQLKAHRLRQPPGIDLVLGSGRGRPFSYRKLAERADEAWEAAGLDRITLHECRHSYASFAIAAGVNAKSLCDYMGHASITTTYDRYGHLMPGNHAEAAGLLDAYLAAATV